MTNKQCTIQKKRRNFTLQEEYLQTVLNFVGGGGGRLNNNNLFYLMGSKFDDATAGSTMSVMSSLVGLWFLP